MKPAIYEVWTYSNASNLLSSHGGNGETGNGLCPLSFISLSYSFIGSSTNKNQGRSDGIPKDSAAPSAASASTGEFSPLSSISLAFLLGVSPGEFSPLSSISPAFLLGVSPGEFLLLSSISPAFLLGVSPGDFLLLSSISPALLLSVSSGVPTGGMEQDCAEVDGNLAVVVHGSLAGVSCSHWVGVSGLLLVLQGNVLLIPIPD